MPRRLGKKFYTDFKFQGRRIRQVMPEARTADQAKRLEAQIRDAYFEGKHGNIAATITLVEFAKKVWLPWSRDHKRSYAADTTHFKVFKEYFGKKSFAEISPIIVERFKRDRLRTPTRNNTDRKPATVNRELAALSKIFRLAIQQKVTSENPVSQVKNLIENNQRTRFLSADEEARLFDALEFSEQLHAIVLVALHTGMRQGEILKLRWKEIDFSTSQIFVNETKTGHNRIVPMNRSVREELEQLPRTKKSEFIFPGTGATGHLVEIKRGWNSATKAAGLEDFHFHDLRHTTASRLTEAGVHPVVVMEILGHTDPKTTKRYSHGTLAAKQDAMTSLENFGQKYVKSEKVLNFKKTLNG